MADIKLFQIKNDGVSELPAESMAVEKSVVRSGAQLEAAKALVLIAYQAN